MVSYRERGREVGREEEKWVESMVSYRERGREVGREHGLSWD